MKVKNKNLVIIIVSICCITTALAAFLCLKKSSEDRLTEAEIAALREEYPICGIDTPPNLSMRTFSLEEVKQIVDSFVYGEVIGDTNFYSKQFPTGYPELDEKQKSKGMSDIYDFYEYTISVIDDTENLYSKGDKITIASNAVFLSYNPQLKDGMKVIIPVKKENDVPGRHDWTVEGTYYVTDDDYVISAFDEEKANVSPPLSGVKLKQLIKELKK